MTTDSGIGEDSSLRRRNGSHGDHRVSLTRGGSRANSSGSETEKSCLLEPSGGSASGVFLENPEYMLLNPTATTSLGDDVTGESSRA